MIVKRLSPKGRSVRITFELPKDAASATLNVTGSFNDWDVASHPMRLLKGKGVWQRQISFKPGQKVEFRYFADGRHWINDGNADAYVPNPYFSENGVIDV